MKKILSKIRFGAVHLAKGGFPLVGGAVNVIENITGKDLATGQLKDVDWSKVALKVLGVAVMLYLVKGGLIPVEDLLKFLKGL